MKQFESYNAVEFYVAGFVYRAHASLPDELLNDITLLGLGLSASNYRGRTAHGPGIFQRTFVWRF